MFPTNPTGTISPTSLRPAHTLQPRVFQTSHSFPLTHSNSTTSFDSNAATVHPSEYLDRHAPLPENWVIQLPSSPTAPSRFQPEVSLLIPDYDGLEEGDARLLRAASAMIAENDASLLAQPHLIDFKTSTQPTFNRGPFRSWNSQPLQVISPLRIHPYTRIVKDVHVPTSSPDSEESFDTPLSERQRRRREQVSSRREMFGIENNSGRRGMGEDTFYGLNRGEQHTPTPIRYAPLMRSTSKFSILDDGDNDEVEVGTGRELWSPELVDMGLDVGAKRVDDSEREREESVVTVLLSTPIREISSASKGSEFELELDVKDESDEEDYPSSPFHPTPTKRTNRRHTISTTPLKSKSPVSPPRDEEEIEITKGSGKGSGERRGKGRRNEKGYKKAEEFKKYLDGERSARDPRFDLKVFHWILIGCPEMQWSSTGYGIEIRDISAFYQNVLHKEAREKRESTGKVVSKRDLPGKSSFERQLSGYGFKRVTTGKFMTIERPDLRRDNHDLLRKVQQVWQVIEQGSMMPKVKVEKSTTTHSLRTEVRQLQSEITEKNTKLEQMENLIKVLAKGEIVTPSKFSAIGITIQSSPAKSSMDMDIDPELVTPVNAHKTRSKSTTATATVKIKTKTKPKTKANPKMKTKVVAKSNKPKLRCKSTNIPFSPISRSISQSKPQSNSSVQHNTPIRSIAELIKDGKRGRGKKRV